MSSSVGVVPCACKYLDRESYRRAVKLYFEVYVPSLVSLDTNRCGGSVNFVDGGGNIGSLCAGSVRSELSTLGYNVCQLSSCKVSAGAWNITGQRSSENHLDERNKGVCSNQPRLVLGVCDATGGDGGDSSFGLSCEKNGTDGDINNQVVSEHVGGCDNFVGGDDSNDKVNKSVRVELLENDKDNVVGTVGVNNVERNRRWRQERKEKKNKRKQMNVDWRRNSAVKVEENKGFFSECDEITRSKLRESRAKLFIAKNEREALEEQRRLNRLESPEDLVRDMIRITGMANRLKKQTKDSKVGGWAETVADSLTKSIADSAPSSVPSLESVGYGKSALKSSDGDGESVKSLRMLEYETVMAMVEKDYDRRDAYNADEYNDAIATVKQNYKDVAFTELERHAFDIERKIGEKFLRFGISSEIVELALEDYKNDC